MPETAFDPTRRLGYPDPAAGGTPIAPQDVGESEEETALRAGADNEGKTILGWGATAAAIFTSAAVLFLIMLGVIIAIAATR
jgi:hypothetical protein